MAIRDKTSKTNYERSLTQLSHNIQKYISLTITQILEKLCKKRDHGMVDLQPILTKTLKQDLLKHQVWNIDKLYKKKHVYKDRKETAHVRQRWRKTYIISYIYIYIYIEEYNVCKKWSQDHGTCNEKSIKTSLHPSNTLFPYTTLFRSS